MPNCDPKHYASAKGHSSKVCFVMQRLSTIRWRTTQQYISIHSTGKEEDLSVEHDWDSTISRPHVKTA